VNFVKSADDAVTGGLDMSHVSMAWWLWWLGWLQNFLLADGHRWALDISWSWHILTSLWCPGRFQEPSAILSGVKTSSDASNHGDPPVIPPEGVGVGLYRSQLWSPFRDFRGSLHKAKLEVAEEMRVSCGKTCCCCQVTIEYIRIYI
jgi:hypothetical protein